MLHGVGLCTATGEQGEGGYVPDVRRGDHGKGRHSQAFWARLQGRAGRSDGDPVAPGRGMSRGASRSL